MQLKLQEANRVLASWGMRADSLKWMEIGYVNRNWLVESNGRRYILRRINHKSPEKLMAEIRYLLFLERKGFKYQVPNPVRTRSGAYFVRHKNRIFWLYPYIDGGHNFELSKRDLGETAKLIASYHRILIKGHTKSKPAADPLDLRYIERNMKSKITRFKRMKKLSERQRVYLEVTDGLLPMLRGIDIGRYTRLDRYPIHGDITADNLIWMDGRLTGIIDFEYIDQSEVLARDLLGMLQYSCNDKKHEERLDFDRAGHFLRSYSRYRKLSRDEIESLPDLMVSLNMDSIGFLYWLLGSDPNRDVNMNDLKLRAAVVRWWYRNKKMIVSRFLRAVNARQG